MAIHDLKGQIGRLPEQPGVYIFLGAASETLYVGKARVLRDRVRSYLAAQGTSPRIDALLRDAAALDVIVTDSVVEALALENRLIKQRNPRYNILLRDDKTYPYLQLTTTERAPRLLVARRVERDGNVYAGPFMPAAVARRTMSLAHRLFGIRSCNEIIDGKRDRPCLEYDIKRCLAPCVASICSLDQYDRAVGQARLLIEGRQDELLIDLRGEMLAAATEERFERAAQLRDAVRTIETLRDRRNSLESTSLGDRDAFGVKLGSAGAIVQVFQMRRGKVVDRVELLFEADGEEPDLLEVLEAGIRQAYAERVPPAEVHVPVELDEDERVALEAWLSEAAPRRVRLVVPKRGERRGLIDLASRNAAMAYQSHFSDGATDSFDALDTLRAVLHLPALPRRIDCFDISTLQGRETVASMVVCVEGRMKRGEYRKFKIIGSSGHRAIGPSSDRAIGSSSDRAIGPSSDWAIGSSSDRAIGSSGERVDSSDSDGSMTRWPDGSMTRSSDGSMTRWPDGSMTRSSDGPMTRWPDGSMTRSSDGPMTRWPDGPILDDFLSIHEVVRRRYQKVLAQGGPFPDLVLIDGGKGQLSAAYDALRELGLERLIAVGIAKQEELLFTRDRIDGVALPHESAALRLIQRIRDEAHRFAVTFHRESRAKRDFHSELDDVPGIGTRRRKQLLTTFGSVAGVRRASRQDLETVVGPKVAEAVIRHFSEQ